MDFAGVYGVSGQRFCGKARMSCSNSYNLEYGSAFQHQKFVVRDICCKSCSEADSGEGISCDRYSSMIWILKANRTEV